MNITSVPVLAVLLAAVPLLAGAQEAATAGKGKSVRAFDGTRVINGHSTRTKARGELDFLIYHRFGPVNGGFYELFGLDQSNSRLGFEYGITGRLDAGIGRSSYNKTFDTYVKWQFLQQQKSGRSIPVTMAWMSQVVLPTLRTPEELSLTGRLAFTHELLISRQFGRLLSLQLMPGLVHLNTVPEMRDPNDIFFLGGAFHLRLSPAVALTGEYYYRFNPLLSVATYDALGIGVDIETGGHIFQLHFTNARPTYESGFIAGTTGNIGEGDIRFGFNIIRTFQVGRY